MRSHLNIRRRLFRKPLNTRQRTEPIGPVIEVEVSGRALLIDLHLADGINRVLTRAAGQDKFIKVDGLWQVLEQDGPLVFNRDIREFCLDNHVGNLL
jgi:hypothetical protein